MQKRKNAGKSDSKFGRLDDEHVLELAEEVPSTDGDAKDPQEGELS